jgi:hypothetical protein
MRHWFALFVLLQMAAAGSVANAQSIAGYNVVHHPVYGIFGMVTAQNRVPAEIGARVL